MKFSELNISHKRSVGQEKTICPKCSHTRKNKKDLCLSLDHDKGLFNCHNCDYKGSIFTKQELEKPIELPKLNRTDLSDKLFDWFFKRGISNNTLIRNQVTEGLKYIPKHNKEMNCIWFNYFENGEHKNTKFRDGTKSFTQVANAKKLFYKIDDLKDSDVAIITEGEIDALSFEEAGLKFAISVPDGALKSDEYSENKLKYVDNCIDYFENIKRIYLATDTDEAGLCLRRELARRLGKERCFIVDFNDCKDANEYLVKYGKESLALLLETAKEYPLEGVHKVEDYLNDVLDLYYNGFKEGLKLDGFDSVNEHISWYAPCLITITGIPSHGKSSWLDQVMMKLCDKWKFVIFSPEHQAKFQIQRLLRIIMGKNFFGSQKMTEAELRSAMNWLNDKIYFLSPSEDDFNLDFIVQKSKELVMRHGIKAVVIDNWGAIEHDFGGVTETQYTSNVLKKLHAFKNTYDLAIFLVAHPTKMNKRDDGTFDVPTLYSINGSSYFYNKSDVGITVYRNEISGVSQIYFQKIKFEGIYGKKGVIEMLYDTESNRYHDGNIDNISIIEKKELKEYINERIESKGSEEDFKDEF